MLNRSAADAESQDLGRDTETKAARRKWNPALHPRDHKGRFIETGGVVRLWGGKRAVVRRALPNDRILVQDAGPDGEFTGRKHTTSAKWVTMLTRPDGSAPTDDQDKVAAEDERRQKDPQRGNGVARDDDGDPNTPNEPHDRDDQGRPIGDDDGDGPEDDDQDEPADGSLPVNRDALPNTQHTAGARFADTAAVRAHFTQLADRPGQRPEMARFLRAVADDEDLQTIPSGRLAVLRDDSTDRWYLTAIGTGQRMEAAGDFDSAQAAARFAAHLDASVLAAAPFDFSDPDLDQAARGWRSGTGENIQAAIVRARQELGAQAPAARPTAPRKTAAARPSTGANHRFSTVSSVRTHWTALRARAAASPDAESSVQSLDELLATERIKLTGDGQFVVAKLPNGRWQLIATGSGMPLQQQFAKQRDAQDFAQQFVASPPRSRDGTPLDLSDPDLSVEDWRSEDNRSLAEVLGGAAAAAPEQAPTAEPAPTTAPVPAAAPANGPSDSVPRADLKPGDRITVTVTPRDLEWPASTRNTDKPETVTIQGIVAPTYSPSPGTTGTPLVDATLTGPDGTALATGEAVHVRRMPATAAVSERLDGYTPEEVRADRVRVGDVVASGTFGYVVTQVHRSPGGPGFTTRNLGNINELDGFSRRSSETLSVIPRARRRPEDVQRDTLQAVQQHANSTDAQRAARDIISDWQRVNDRAMTLWPDGVPQPFHAMRRNMQNVTETPKGAEGYQQNAQAIRGTLAALDDVETDGLDAELLKALHRFEGNLDSHVDKFDADARAITANKQKRREQSLQSRPPVEDLDAEQLRAEYDELIVGDLGTAGETRLEAIKRERRDRDKRAITDREAPESLSTSDLRGEQLEFARNRTSYESDDVAEARRQRMTAVNAELERREAEEATGPDATTTPDSAPSDTSAPQEPLRHAWDDPDQFITVTMPEALFGFLYVDETASMEDPDTRKALTESVKGPNGTRKITGPVAVHRALLAWAWMLEGGEGLESDPDEARAYGDYAKRIDKADAKLQSRKRKTDDTPSPAVGNENSDGTVTLTPDEVTEQLNAVRPSGSKAPSSMSNNEIRDEAVTLMEREMANGGELTGADRTRLRVLEAEEARRAGRAPKREETKPKPPVEEPGGLFDTEEPAAPQTAADLNNPDDRPADAFGTPDLFAAAEGRDTTGLRPPQMRVPEDLAVGDRFLDADGRTHVVDQAPVRTGRGRVRVISGDGRNHFFARDTELRVLYPDETAPEPTGRDATTPGPEATPAPESGGRPWQQMRPEDFGQDAPPTPVTAPEVPRTPDEYGTPDLIANGSQPQTAAGDEVSVARTIRDGLPELPPLPNLGGLSRQDKDDVRRIRSDYANIVRSLDGILAGEPPTGDTREDLRRVRNELEYVSGRLNEHLLSGSDQAQDVRRKLLDLREQLDQAVNALPERAPQPQGDGPNGGTLYHPWDVADGDLVRFDAENPADRERSLASYYGTYRGGSSSATGEQGRTLVTYQSLQWNDDRQQWENDLLRHTVTMPPRGLVERFTEEEWNTWRRPNSAEPETAAPEDREEAPPAPIGEQAGRDLDDAAIDAELQALQEWQNRHVRRSGEGPHVQGSLTLALTPVANRRAELNEVQRERLNAERQRQQREEKARRKAEALGRARIGKRNAEGSYPVSVDDREIGTVRQLGRQWMFKHEDGSESGLEHPSRGDAAAALVELDDRRQKEEVERGEQEEARRQTPAGWVHGDRDELAENDIIRVPVTQNDREGRPYPVRWRDPVRVRSVERLSNGTTMVNVENLDGSRSDVSPLMLRNTEGEAGFAWRQGRTRPEPTPAWRHELRNRMADIGDDIATLHRLEGFEDQERIGALADLIQRVENHRSPDLPGDLRSIVAETAWLEEQFDDPDLPYETRSRRSWATAANRKAQSALANPDFQQIAPEQDSTGNPAWTWDLGDGVWIDRPRSEGSPNGPSGGPRNVYVGGRIEGLIGQERPRGNYFWWRPGGQTGEGRYAHAEDAARGFARDLRETDLPSLSARRADDESNRPNPGDSNSQPGGEETSAEPTGGFVTDGVTANADVAAHMTEIAPLLDAVRALGIDPGLARQYWEQARTAFAEDNPRMGLFRLQDAERHAWNEIRRLEADGADSDAIEALKTWAVSMNHARVRMTSTPGPGERYVTYGELRPGDVLRWPYVTGYAVWGEPTYPQAPPDHELWVNPMYLDGQSSNSQMPYPRTNLALVSDDSEAIDAARQALLVRRAADEEALANRRRELEAARAERAEAERPAVEGELVEPGNLAVGDEVNVSGRNNRGQDRTWRGRLLAEPRRVTVQRGGQRAEAWRLHIGEEGQEPTLGNMLTVGVDERVDRIGTPNRRTEERDAPGRAGDDDEPNRGDGDPADSSAGPEASEDSNREQREDNGREEQRNRRRGTDRDGEAGGPDGGPDGGSGGDGPDAPDMPDSTGEGNGLNRDADDEERKRRRRRRDGGNGNGGSGGSGRPGGPGLPHLNLPDSDSSGDTRSPAGDSGGGEDDPAPRPRARRTSIDDQRQAWSSGEDLTPAEDIPERRAHLAQLAARDSLALSESGGLVMWREPQPGGGTNWRFAQARTGNRLANITLTSSDPEEARALAGRFEEIADANGDVFDWNAQLDRSTVAQWRDGEGRNLPDALLAVREDYRQEREGAFALPDDLTGLTDDELAAAYGNGLSPSDTMRLMAEMDRRDDTDQRIRAAVPDTPPANAEEAERRGRAMDEALGFGDTDVTRPAPATPGRLRREFDALDEERFAAAMQETGGTFFNADSQDSDVDPRALFSGRSVTAARARELASDELRDWFDRNDGRLTYSTYSQRERDRVLRAEFEEIDEARYRAAEAETNGYFFRRQHDGGTISDRELFSGGSLSQFDRWRDIASEELRDWFDANGGRLTFNQFKNARRDDERAARELYEEEERQAAQSSSTPETGEPQDDGRTDQGPGDQTDAVPAQAEGDITALLASEPGPDDERVTLQDLRAGDVVRGRFGGWSVVVSTPSDHASGNNVRFHVVSLDGSGSLNGPYPSDDPIVRSTNPDLISYGGPVREARLRDVAESAARWERRQQEVAELVARLGPPSAPAPDPDSPDADRARRPISEAFGARVSPDKLAAGDAVRVLGRDNEGGMTEYEGSLLAAPELVTVHEFGRIEPAWRLHVGETGDAPRQRNSLTVPHDGKVTRLDSLAPYTADDSPAPANTAAPDETEAPQPIGGQPAHWARVDDLTPGDTVRMTGTTRRGRHVQRAGYVYNPPVRVEVTRRGRTEYMWRTWVTQNADGTGDAGNVYTTLNATAARAESPDDVAPGSPANGAQSAILAGDLPDTIPADREGRGLFPGSTVTNTNDREGTVTGATTNTVVVNWADSRDDTTESPTNLTVTTEERPDGWTTAGQRVRPDHIVSDNEGVRLGPVDEVDGDNITVATAGGPITRSAGELQVSGEVRDDVPAPDPVADIDELTAADLKDGDTIALDEDGFVALVEVVGNPRRNGDRVTFEWVWPVTAEMGESEVDASAVFQRALGPDGGRPDLGPDDAPEPPDDMTVHEPARQVDPVTGPTVDPGLTTGDRTVIGDHADGPDNNPDAQQAAARITADLPVTPEQASALAAHLRESADPSTGEGRAALRAADHLDQAAGRTPPPGLNRPRPSNAAQLTDGDIVAMPDERQNDQVHVYRVLDIEEGPGGVRRLLLEDENQQWRRRIVHGAMPVWQLPEAQPDPVTPPDIDPEPNTPTAPTASVPRTAPATPSTPATPAMPVARLLPGVLREGDMIDAPTSRSGYQFNGHRRLTLISAPHRNGWWMQLTGMDEDGNVHDFGLHSGRAVNVYERNRPTPGLPPTGEPRDPNPAPDSNLDRLVRDHGRSLSLSIINEAIAGTDPAGTIHALREQIAQHLTPDALRAVRAQTRQEGLDALDAAGITGPARDAARKELKQARRNAHAATVRAALRTINDLEPLPGESEEDLAARARDLLRLIPDGVAARQTSRDRDGGIADTVTGHADRAMSALLQQLQDAGVDPGDAEQLARMLTRQLSGSRNDTARRIARRVAAASPDAAQRPGLIAGILALLIRMAKRLVELVKAGARKIAEKWQGARERLARLRAFFGRLVRRVRQWPESRRLARLQRAVDLPEADGDSLAARVTHWAALMPEPGHFGQTNRRVTWWRPTTWGQLAAGQLPDRSDRIQWAPDQAADGGPGLTALRHMAALRAAGGDVDQDVTRRLASFLGDDFGDDPHATLQEADEHVADSERRLVNLQAARSGATIPDDPDLEVEITAARAEVTGARNEYEILRARYAAAVPDAVAAALAEIRDMGPDGSTSLVFGPDTDPDAERAVRGVQRLVPRSWLTDAPVRRVTAVNGDAGRYEPQGQRITVADLADDGLGTAGHALAQHLAQHLGDLDAAQRAFWFTQTHTGRPGARRMRQTALGRLLSRQQRTQPETGDTLARSVQSMFNGDWYQDDDLRQFLLGLLATR
ncbi:hypothetical protein [Streptomyces anulatus]|uniref:hypothetical protein n=1 Tax=Streptomyces anulatus TaxID=1892 RepID=UPI0036652531